MAMVVLSGWRSLKWLRLWRETLLSLVRLRRAGAQVWNRLVQRPERPLKSAVRPPGEAVELSNWNWKVVRRNRWGSVGHLP